MQKNTLPTSAQTTSALCAAAAQIAWDGGSCDVGTHITVHKGHHSLRSWPALLEASSAAVALRSEPSTCRHLHADVAPNTLDTWSNAGTHGPCRCSSTGSSIARGQP